MTFGTATDVKTTSAGGQSGSMDESIPRSIRPSIWPIIDHMESKMRHTFFLSNSPYRRRTNPYRQGTFHFLELPPEVRERIYELAWGTTLGYYFAVLICFPSVNIRRAHDRGLPLTRGCALLFVNKQVSREAAHVLYSQSQLKIDSVPYRKPENLRLLTADAATWFASTTRRVAVRTSFSFEAERNEAWVKVLGAFRGLRSLEVIIDFGRSLTGSNPKVLVSNLVPFGTLQCESITFRAPHSTKQIVRDEVEAAWQDTFAVNHTGKTPVIKIVWDFMPRGGRKMQSLPFIDMAPNATS